MAQTRLGGSVENVSVLVAIGVDDTGHREVIGVTEGMKEDKASWEQFIRSLIERGLKGVRLVVGDRCAGLVSTVNAMLPDAGYQRCMVHFMRNVLSRVSHKHMAWAASALKAIFAMESRESALEKAECVAAQMESTGLKAAASCLREGVGEATTYLLDEYPVEHRRRIRTNNMIERLNREIRRRTRVSARSPTAGARSCSSARASATSPPTNGPRAATWTCPGSVTPCSQPTETDPATGQTAFAQDFGHNPCPSPVPDPAGWLHTAPTAIRHQLYIS